MTKARLQVLALALLLTALAAAAATLQYPGSLGVVRLSFWRPDSAQRTRILALERERLAHLPSWEPYRDFGDLFMRLNLAVLEPSTHSSAEKTAWLAQRFEDEAKAFLEKHGINAYLAVGTHLELKFRDHLAKVMRKLADSAEPLSAWQQGHDQDGSLTMVRALSGRFLEKAASAGLLAAPGGTDVDHLLIASLLWLDNWMLTARRLGHEIALERTEAAILVRWKIEASQHLALSRRLELVPLAQALDPDYPGTYVSGVLLALEGSDSAAAAAFLECLEMNEQTQSARRWLIELRREAFFLAAAP